MNRPVTLYVLTMAVFGCGKRDNSTAAPSPPEEKPMTQRPAPAAPSQVEAKPESLTWQRKTIEELGLSVDLIANEKIVERGIHGASGLRQRVHPVSLAVWWGPTRTLESWRAGFASRKAATLSAVTSMKVCNQPASRQNVRMPEVKYRSGRYRKREPEDFAQGNVPNIAAEPASRRLKTRAARVVHAMSFSYKGTSVIMTWAIPQHLSESFGHKMEHFFGSVKCVGP